MVPNHSNSASDLTSILVSSVGGEKIMADAIGVSRALIQAQTKEQKPDGDGYARRPDIERVDQMILAAINADQIEVAWMTVRHFMETFDQGMAERVHRKIETIQDKPDRKNLWALAGKILRLIPLVG